ncbi:MAG: cytochrome c oxidase assembly protein [Acidimicrobiales bacterium]
MSEEASTGATASRVRTFRNFVGSAGALLLVLCVIPPFYGWSRRYEFVQAAQFLSFAVLVPALLVVGSPWRWLRLAGSIPPRVDDDGHLDAAHSLRLIDRYALARTRQGRNVRALWLMVVFLALTIFWRSAPAVDFTVRHGWVVVLEALSTVLVGVVLWTDLVESPPLTPGATRPYRIAMAAVAMWTIWILAYLDAMSRSSWYSVFPHVAGHGLSQAADQQFSAGVMWFLSAAAFMPVVFWNLVHWLQSDEDPTDELNRLIKRERTLGF